MPLLLGVLLVPPTFLIMPQTKQPPNTLVLRPAAAPDSPLVDVDDSLYSDSPTPHSAAKSYRDEVYLTPNSKKKRKVQQKDKCPCSRSDPSSSYVKCAKCKQQWHNKCSNLIGLDQKAIKKLEHWYCPRCYTCPYLCDIPATLYTEFQSVKDSILNSSMSKANLSSFDSTDLKQEIALLRSVVDDMSKRIPPEPAQQASLPVLNNIEGNLALLTERVLSLGQSLSSTEPCPAAAPNSATDGHNRAQLQPPMVPNTQSPSLRQVATPCEPYLHYKPGSIPDDIKRELLDHFKANETNFTPMRDGSRDVLYYGEHSYKYTGHEHPKKEMPPVISKLLSLAKETLAPNQETINLNSCLVTRYKTSANHIPLHRDDEPVIDPESLIITASLGASRTMSFENNDQSQQETLTLEDGSMLSCSRFSQDFWKHGIIPESQPSDEGERISLTFRNISPHYINSTIILGDSNTTHIRFGSTAGTLGAWMPGKRVKAGHIEALPAATEIGPYRNIIIHTGINSISNPSHRKSDNYLLHFLENRCKEISSVYPRSKICLSTLLPTRSRQLNRRVEEFNQGILDISFRLKNVLIVDNSIFGPVLSDEHGRWDSIKRQPLATDALHLGKKGIRQFAMNIKSVIFRRRKSQSRARFNASGGTFQSALTRSDSNRQTSAQGFVGFDG